MKKLAVALALGASLALLPVSASFLSPPEAAAAKPAAAKPAKGGGSTNPGLFILDLVVLRPAAIIVLGGAVITYPIVALVSPFFLDDSDKFSRDWVGDPYTYAIERPLGKWKDLE
ncbi:MAG: hypothetical protein V3V62_00985 [bacterium]